MSPRAAPIRPASDNQARPEFLPSCAITASKRGAGNRGAEIFRSEFGERTRLACPFRRLAEMLLLFNQNGSLARRQRQHARARALPRPQSQRLVALRSKTLLNT